MRFYYWGERERLIANLPDRDYGELIDDLPGVE